MNAKLLFIIPLLPLLAATVNALVGRLLPRVWRGILAVGAVGCSFLLTCLLWQLSAGEGTRTTLATWLASGNFRADFGILFDPLSASMTLMVTGVSTLIHLYAVGYMDHEEDTARFFTLLNLFVFSMLTIVLADNLLLLFLGWEGVGLCSYGLIGFWYRKVENAAAGRKAFLVTRVGDVFLAIAVLWLFALLGSVDIPTVNAAGDSLAAGTVTAIVLLLLGGACGKSAQLPLMTWLPDAMAGPTPVSALIHAATMVTAGVYLLCRLFPFVSLSATGMTAIALVGGLTALYAATCAVAQREIKRVLAYSTMSQIGYMFIGVGVGTASGAMFHLYTHAFFKALLFMAAGCVIHLCNEENDIYRMGGVFRKNRFVFWMFLAGSLCLAGLPFSGGYFSKDGILLAASLQQGGLHRLIWLFGLTSAFLTSFYTFRLLFLVFAGDARQPGEAHSLQPLMRWTLPPLALLGLGGGLLNLPELYGGDAALQQLLAIPGDLVLHVTHKVEIALGVVASGLFGLGALAAWGRYHVFPGERPHWGKRFLLRGWEADSVVGFLLVRPFTGIARFFWKGLDVTVIEGVLHETSTVIQRQGERLRHLTTGRISTYLTGFAWGLLLFLGWMLLETVRH